ncbi:NAD(P)/FAD-dependent oxidoreductase [Oceanicola sp. 22II-s10i]|uniref:flavin-containing monooxygenase n=1 Tax=Oceanicola sp. 22II-s10i TaxID=1317116 RepID=UPI000B5276D4|nr:NAD(P)/FAD-dependent oxidoreductase [Oceanicola sp. 22II-s10i]
MGSVPHREIRRRLEGADCVPLALSLVQLTGDLSLLDEIQAHVHGPWDYSHSLPDALQSRIRDRMADAMAGHAGTGAAPLGTPDAETMQRMMSVVVGEPVAPEYVPMALEQMELSASGKVDVPEVDQVAATDFPVIIVGAGASGICAAIQLGQMGVPYVLLEKNPAIGGTWYENRYPGCAVDTPNHFYQFAFEPNDEWPEYFSHQASILDYLRHCVDRYELAPNMRLGREVVSAEYCPDRQMWTVTARTEAGDEEVLEARAVISAVGQLNRPSIPDLPGLASFVGPALHTAQWPEEGLDLDGKRVALVGTGASAVQVGPAIVDRVAALTVLQRSGAWVARRPNIDRLVSDDTKWALKAVPFYASWYRFQLFWGFADGLFDALRIDPEWQGGGESINAKNQKLREAMTRHIKRELEGREDLLDKVIPDYPPFGKRVLADAGWYRMLRQDHVELVSTGIDHVEPDAIVLTDGRRIEVDAIIFATGFQAGKMLWPMHIKGRGEQSIRELWGDDDPRAFLGIAVPEFPNLFVMYGPNTNLGHGGSAIFLAECQMRFIASTIAQMINGGHATAEIRRDVHDRYNDEIDAKLRDLVWSHPSVTTWYKNPNGRIITNQPWRLVEYWRLTHDADMADFITEPAAGKQGRASRAG